MGKSYNIHFMDTISISSDLGVVYIINYSKISKVVKDEDESNATIYGISAEMITRKNGVDIETTEEDSGFITSDEARVDELIGLLHTNAVMPTHLCAVLDDLTVDV